MIVRCSKCGQEYDAEKDLNIRLQPWGGAHAVVVCYCGAQLDVNIKERLDEVREIEIVPIERTFWQKIRNTPSTREIVHLSTQGTGEMGELEVKERHGTPDSNK